ncbi:shikimate dehydrogenase [Amorphus orientalis]|uniref:Shikimate dehydrogenase (NADP(+)) n=1 Tax=Amorphus orientalis TaxID=649198 RepID=A0AAE3VKH2_9HYPH|nr:shikimate dehydrogenase [Amorphus orientalis]MDQ0313726.1 shikimate dehydrogenase [Amorphus orientalis]
MSLDGPKSGVIGWPIAHSRSPLIHRFWLQTYGLPGAYDAIAVSPETAETFFTTFRSSGLVGANVTVPHKIAAASACDDLSGTAEALGAVNTLWLEGDRLLGDNTDVHGFLANLDEKAPGWEDAEGDALVIGAGGAARAVVYGLISRGLQVVIANRTKERADQLADAYPDARSADYSALAGDLGSYGLVVNTTSLGMAGKGQVPIDLAGAADATVVADIVYVPLETGLLRQARQRGLRTVDGLGMLLHQAAPGFERWFGRRPEITDRLRAAVLADLAGAS